MPLSSPPIDNQIDSLLEPQLEQWKAVIDALPDPVFILTETGLYADLVGGRDPGFYHDGAQLIGKHLSDVVSDEKVSWFLSQIKMTLDSNRLHTVEYGLSGNDVKGINLASGPNGTLWFEGRLQPLKTLYAGERAVVWVARNITSRHQLENKLRILSETDDLTGVYNKRKLLQELKTHYLNFTQSQKNIALLMLDADYFKQINDLYGHLKGDEVLTKMAQCSTAELNNRGSLFRFGGEEFAIILPSTSIKQAEEFANQLRVNISKTLTLPQIDRISVSIGITQFIESDKQEDTVIGRADQALYQAKEDGRNCVRIWTSLLLKNNKNIQQP